MKKTGEHLSHLIYIILGVFLAFIFQKASSSAYNAEGFFHGINFNLFTYVAALACAFVLWLLYCLVMYFIGRAEGSVKQKAEERQSTLSRIAGFILYVIYGAASAAVLLLIYEIYINENNLWPGTASQTFLRQEITHRYYFAMIVLVAGVLFLTLSRKKTEQNLRFRAGSAFIFAVISALATYCPNIFADKGAGVPHIHAVTNSIVNVAHFQPYNELNCSIYGHFGLIFLPFVKLFGNDLTGILLSISFFTLVSFLAAFYVAHKMIRPDSIYLMALAAITGTTTIFTRRGQYFQINPLRLLFPMLMLAVIAWRTGQTVRKKILLARILEYVCGILAVIWNFETGLFCIAVCAAVSVFRDSYGSKPFSKKTLVLVLKAALYAAVSLAGAYVIVNIYNLLTGGSMNSIKLFIYPLMSGTYDVDNLRVPLPSVRFLYFFQILLFFLTALIMIERQWRNTENDRCAGILRFAVSLSGLSSLIYFMNRAAYSNMSIAHIQMVLLLASFGQHALDLNQDTFRKKLSSPLSFFRYSLAVILFGGCVWMAVEGAMYIEVCYDYRADSSWKKQDFAVKLEELRTTIPENTWGFGYCVPELWYQLGWDNICFMTDWSDINDYNKEYALSEAQKHDAFVTTSKDLKFKGYRLDQTVTIGPYDFKLYVKKEAKS